MPTPEALDALAQACLLATDPQDVLTTSVAAILCSAPERINEVLLEQFVRWAYNAGTRGLTEDFLNQPLPPPNRLGNRQSRR